MKLQDAIRESFEAALERAGLAAGETRIILEKPRLKEHGDVCSPLAMALAKRLGKDPLRLAERIAAAMAAPADLISAVTVARPGFINLTLASPVLEGNLQQILSQGDGYGSSELGGGIKFQVEFVSANPTGPLVIVSARAAAVGSAIVNLLRFVGYDARAEYYVNDFGNQVRALGESLRYRTRELAGRLAEAETLGAYPGEYLRAVAAEVPAAEADRWDRDEDPLSHYGAFASAKLLESIRADLDRFGVRFDNFFFESALHPDWIRMAERLIGDKGFSLEQDGAVYFQSSRLGDQKDRVIRKSDGLPTYLLGDIAYHLTKLDRGFEKVVDIWGPDHHGHIPRMQAAATVLGAPPGWLEVDIVGWVRLIEGGKPVSMSKRAGEFITLRDLVDDVGRDVAKYFFLMRRPNTPLDFDLDLARKQSDENPVFYVQYAHARISSVLRFAAGKGFEAEPAEADLGRLGDPAERDLMVHLAFFPSIVEGAAASREPHRLAVYAQELATLFHHFYHDHQIVSEEGAITSARLVLADATRQVLKNCLLLMGIDAPSSM
jgi:arginyl-tRNA synthetase